jgi:hypothetical protein
VKRWRATPNRQELNQVIPEALAAILVKSE